MQADETQYAVFIDAGSSGTRLHVYRYLPQKWPRYARISPQQDVLKVEPGLSSYAGRPEAAAASLQPLLDFATSKVSAQGLAGCALLHSSTSALPAAAASPTTWHVTITKLQPV
jgi:Golgi nucleoside diphosphatase